MTNETKNRELRITRDPTKTECRQMTEGMLNPSIRSAEIATLFSESSGWTTAGFTEAVEVLTEKTKAVNNGDLSDLESTLVAQSAALNSIFIELARRAHLNMGTHMDATERYLKLALKAQSQCRTTIETLAVMKNPPVFAKQANINNGGNQQINNGVTPNRGHASQGVSSHASNPENSPIKLLEAVHGKWVDTGKKSKASRGNKAMEAVGEVDRA